MEPKLITLALLLPIGEHSCMDGTPTLRMNEFIISSIARGAVDHHSERDVRSDIPPPRGLSFALSNEVEMYIKDAEKRYDELIGAHDMHVRQGF